MIVFHHLATARVVLTASMTSVFMYDVMATCLQY